MADCLLLVAYTMGISKDSGKQQTSWGDAPAGYDQFMDNKGLLIAGASIVAGAVLGRMRLLIWNHLSISEPEEQYQEDHLIPTLPVVQ